jgi:hypothetical protein
MERMNVRLLILAFLALACACAPNPYRGRPVEFCNVYLWSHVLGGECCEEVTGPNVVLDNCAYAEDIRERALQGTVIEADSRQSDCSDQALSARVSVERYELGQPNYYWAATLTILSNCKRICRDDGHSYAFDAALLELLEKPLSQAQRLAIRRKLHC